MENEELIMNNYQSKLTFPNLDSVNTYIINVSTNSDVKGLIEYVMNLFNLNKRSMSKLLNHDKNINQDSLNMVKIELKGIKSAIDKVVLISEVVKSRIKGIHQILDIGCLNNDENIYNDDYINKIIPKISITLTNFEPKIKDFGYRAPYSMSDLYKLNTVVSKNILNQKSLKKENLNFQKDKMNTASKTNNHNDLHDIHYQTINDCKLNEDFHIQCHYKSMYISSSNSIRKLKEIHSKINENLLNKVGTLNIKEKNLKHFSILNKCQNIFQEILKKSLSSKFVKNVFIKFDNLLETYKSSLDLFLNEITTSKSNNGKKIYTFTNNENKKFLDFECFIFKKIRFILKKLFKKLVLYRRKLRYLLSINIKKYNKR